MGVSTAADANRNAVVIDAPALREIPIFDNDVIGTMSRFLDPGSLGSDGATLVVDGMEARKVGVSLSGIQQVKINQDPYAAEFQRPGRGRIEVITKAGSDAYHGSLDVTFRDARLNARDPFAETHVPEQRRIYEGAVGGPFINGKTTSFLVTVDRREEDLQSIVYAYGLAGPIRASVPRVVRGAEVSGSIAHRVGSNHTFSIRATGESDTVDHDGVGGTTLPEAGWNQQSDEAQLIVGDRWIASKNVLHEWRFLVGRETQSTVGLSPDVRVVVLDAFTGGSAQNDLGTTENHFTFADGLTILHGRHVWKAGFAIPDWSWRGFDERINRAGTFTFGSLDEYGAGQPLSFTQQRGDGALSFLQKVFALYVQDQIALTPSLSLGLGVRYDWQNVFTDSNNLAPRASLAWAMSKSTVVRGGAGWFYDRAGGGPIREILRSRAARLFRYRLLQPSYPDPFAGGGMDTLPPRDLVTVAPRISIPYTVQYSAGIEHEIHKGTTLTATYIGSRGVDLFRSRDVNAPPPPLYEVRPDSTLGQVRQIEATGRQTLHSLQLTVRGRFTPRVQGTVQYTLGSAYNDTSGISSLPANNYDLASEWGRADFDQRHRLEALGQFDLGRWLNFGVSVSAASGRPYSMRTGQDDFNTGQTNARPEGVARNTLPGPDYVTVDVRWSHAFEFGSRSTGERPGITVGVDAFNLCNRVNYDTYVGTLTSPFFGSAVAALPPRRVQVSAGVKF